MAMSISYLVSIDYTFDGFYSKLECTFIVLSDLKTCCLHLNAPLILLKDPCRYYNCLFCGWCFRLHDQCIMLNVMFVAS